jgi:hypothetical protein
MGCPVCGKSSSVKKALTKSFKKEDIQDMLRKLKEQRREEIRLGNPR